MGSPGTIIILGGEARRALRRGLRSLEITSAGWASLHRHHRGRVKAGRGAGRRGRVRRGVPTPGAGRDGADAAPRRPTNTFLTFPTSDGGQFDLNKRAKYSAHKTVQARPAVFCTRCNQLHQQRH